MTTTTTAATFRLITTVGETFTEEVLLRNGVVYYTRCNTLVTTNILHDGKLVTEGERKFSKLNTTFNAIKDALL